jgi:hypothetical protein
VSVAFLLYSGREVAIDEMVYRNHPRITMLMLTNMALGIADRLRKATRAMSAFD